MSKLVEHARRELELCGQFAEDPSYAQSIVAAVAAFASYGGHSGTSAQVGRWQLSKLLNFEHLAPLTDDPEEWRDVSEYMPDFDPTWQNIRNSACMSHDGGKTYYSLNEDTDTVYTSAKKEVVLSGDVQEMP